MLLFSARPTALSVCLVVSLSSLIIGVTGQSWNYSCATIGTEKVLCTATIREGACAKQNQNETAEISYANLDVEALGEGPDFKLKWTSDNLRDYNVQLARFNLTLLCHVPDICISIKAGRPNNAPNQRTTYQLTLPLTDVTSLTDVLWKIDVMPDAAAGSGPIFNGYYYNPDKSRPIEERRIRVLVHILDGGKLGVQIADPRIRNGAADEPSEFSASLVHFDPKTSTFKYSPQRSQLATGQNGNEWNVTLAYDSKYTIFGVIIKPDPTNWPSPCYKLSDYVCKETRVRGIVTTRPGCESDITRPTPSESSTVVDESSTVVEENSKGFTLPTGPTVSTTYPTEESTPASTVRADQWKIDTVKETPPGIPYWIILTSVSAVLGTVIVTMLIVLLFRRFRGTNNHPQVQGQGQGQGGITRSESCNSVDSVDLSDGASTASHGSIISLISRKLKRKRRLSPEEKLKKDESWKFVRQYSTPNAVERV